MKAQDAEHLRKAEEVREQALLAARNAVKQIQQGLKARDAAVRDAHQAGVSLYRIAKEAGMSYDNVRRIARAATRPQDD